MTIAQDRFRRIQSGFAAARGVLTTLGIYTTQVFVVRRTWEGGRRSSDGGYIDQAIYQGNVIARATGAGNATPTIGLEIVPRPRCRMISSREQFSSGGVYHEGDVRVTFIQPYWVDSNSVQHGYGLADIAPDPADTDGVETIYFLTGGITGEYYRIGSVLERFAHYELTLTARRTTPGKL